MLNEEDTAKVNDRITENRLLCLAAIVIMLVSAWSSGNYMEKIILNIATFCNIH